MANMEYLNNYEKENLRQIRLKINRKTEPDKRPENLNEVTYSAGACTPGAFAIY